MKINKSTLLSMILLTGITGLSQGADVSTLVLGAKKRTLSPDTNIMTAGYYPAATLSAIDTDLTAGNIKSGIIIFGITGTLGSPPGIAGIGLPDTGQTLCYNEAGNVISCPAPGETLAQDGSYQPAAVQQSYADNGDGTTTDNITGLMWVKDTSAAGIGGLYNWTNAIIACEMLNYAGYSDWRLPNVKELMSILNFQRTFPSTNPIYFPTAYNSFWSSTTYVLDTTKAWHVYFVTSGVGQIVKTDPFLIRCVRGGP